MNSGAVLTDAQLTSLTASMVQRLGGGSIAGTPAGARPEGPAFAKAVKEAWLNFFQLHEQIGAPLISLRRVQLPGKSTTIALAATNSSAMLHLIFPLGLMRGIRRYERLEMDIPEHWLQRKFKVRDLMRQPLGDDVLEFAPPAEADSPKYWDGHYPALFGSSTTSFDFAVLLVSGGSLIEKMLFEYKYAKSTGEERVDGNAHERLSFQIMQYLEVNSLHPQCSFNVVMSDAFVRFRNKYHPSFHQQAVRLTTSFPSFKMRIASCRSEYISMFRSLSIFLRSGQLLPNEF